MENQNKINIAMPCKCVIEVDKKRLTKKINKYFISHIECKKHNISGNDVYLKKKLDNSFEAVIDQKRERKLFKEEDDFFVMMYNEKLCECPSCKTLITGKNLISVTHLKNSYWEIDYKCDKCNFDGSTRIDINKLPE